jgi:hypothetical protein
MRRRAMLLCLLSACLLPAAALNGGEPLLMKLSLQMMVVTTPEWNATTGTLRRYERTRANKPWDLVGEPIPVMVDKGGLAWGEGSTNMDDSAKSSDDPAKKDGDGKTPAGVFRLGTTFGYAEQRQQAWRMGYVSVASNYECVDDPGSKSYNKMVDKTKVNPVDWKSAQDMHPGDDRFVWGLTFENNHSNKAGQGACSFLEVGTDQPSDGSIAAGQAGMETILGWLEPHVLPVLLVVPDSAYKKLQPVWNLP